MANATEWSERVAEWRASGLSAAQFCVDKDYSDKSLWQWSSRLGRASKAASSQKPSSTPTVPMARLVRDGKASAAVDVTQGIVRVELGGARIEVRGSVSVGTLRAVFEALQAGSPAGRT